MGTLHKEYIRSDNARQQYYTTLSTFISPNPTTKIVHLAITDKYLAWVRWCLGEEKNNVIYGLWCLIRDFCSLVSLSVSLFHFEFLDQKEELENPQGHRDSGSRRGRSRFRVYMEAVNWGKKHRGGALRAIKHTCWDGLGAFVLSSRKQS